MRQWFKHLVILGLISAFSPRPVSGADWADTFPVGNLETYLEGGQLRFLLVEAGDETGDLRAAARALTASLRSSGRTRLVMEADAIGDVKGLDDRAIVARGAGMPIDAICVLRVFPGKEGGVDTAVVTFYDKQGAVITAFTAGPGRPLIARPASGAGVDAAAARTVASVIQDNRKSGEESRQAFKRKRIWFTGGGLVDGMTGRVVAAWAVPHEGESGMPLDWDEFYEKVGREDLASSYNTRRGVKAAFLWGGLAVVLGGAIYMALGADYSAEELDMTPFAVGGGIAAGGSLLAMVSFFIDPHPVSFSEVQHLADAHNQRIEEELGVPGTETAAKQSQGLGIKPYVGPGGGGVSLGFRF